MFVTGGVKDFKLALAITAVHAYNCFTAIIQVNTRQPVLPAKNCRILFEQSFTAHVPLLTTTITFGLGRIL